MATLAPTLPVTLKHARKARRWSQLELSLRLGVSQRHVSFVESGRARPSRDLLAAWLRELGAPLGVHNEAMLQAGYAPLYGAAPLDDPALAQADHALERLLRAHDPMPALVLDAHWNLVRLNRGGQWLAATLMPDAPPPADGRTINLLDLLAHPDGFTKRITNLHEVGPPFLAHLRHEAASHPALASKVEAVAARVRERLGDKHASAVWPHAAAPVLTTRYATPYGELASSACSRRSARRRTSHWRRCAWSTCSRRTSRRRRWWRGRSGEGVWCVAIVVGVQSDDRRGDE